MKVFWISLTIIATMFLALSLNTWYLGQFLDPLQEQLNQAAAYAKTEDWETAETLTRQVRETWHNKRTYLHVTLKHQDIDTIYILLDEVVSYLEYQDISEYIAANTALVTQLGFLHEMEQLSLQNIL